MSSACTTFVTTLTNSNGFEYISSASCYLVASNADLISSTPDIVTVTSGAFELSTTLTATADLLSATATTLITTLSSAGATTSVAVNTEASSVDTIASPITMSSMSSALVPFGVSTSYSSPSKSDPTSVPRLTPLDASTGMVNHAVCFLAGPERTDSEKRFVTIPDARGTLQILWTCISTLVICVYQVLHLNIPPCVENAKPRFQLWKTIGWSLVVLAVPEFILTESIYEFWRAKRSRRELLKDVRIPRHGKDSWTLTHFFYANMGGFVFKHNGVLRSITGEEIRGAINENYISNTAPITRWEIEDKSKEGVFLKSIAILQLIYFYVQVLARWGEDLKISQLELSVAAIGIYSLATYAFLWRKPKSVDIPTMVTLLKKPRELDDGTATLVDNDNEHETGLSELRSDGGSAFIRESRMEKASWLDKALSRSKIATLGAFVRDDDASFGWVALAVLCISVPQGAIHVAGWNLAFPTTQDVWLWRIASILSTASGPAIGVLVLALAGIIALGDVVDNRFVEAAGWLPLSIIGLLVATLALLYFPARLILLAEMIRTLFYLPPSAFKAVTWAMSIPHFS